MAPRPLTRFPSTADVADMLLALEVDGGLIVEGMFDAATIAAMRDAADARAADVAPGSATQGLGEDGAAFVGANTIRFSSLGRMSPAFFDMLDNPIFAALADAVLLPTSGSYWVNTGQVMYIGPGEPAQALHRDANNWWEFVSRTWPDSPEVTLSAMIGLEDVTEELGATRVVPGSHKNAEISRFGEADSVPAELGPGDALIYSGYVFHGGGANRTDRWRRAMHLSFVAGWLTPEEASPLDYTTDELADRSPRVRRLLGHQSYDPRPHPGGGLWLKDVRAIEDARPENGGPVPDITITRDQWGIAHVDAPDETTAFIAQGYCAAADRFWQMEYDRLKAAGRWSEVVGTAGVREDTFFRRIGIETAARRDWDGLSAEAKAMTEAYAAGVNRWLDENRDSLPAEFDHHPFAPEPWEAWHCNAVYKVRHVFMGTFMRKLWRGAVLRAGGPEITAAMKGDPGAATPMVPPTGPSIDLLDGVAEALAAAADDLAGIPDVDGASNSWAVHGSRTASGLPLLAGDPHRGIEFPNVYLQFHMACDAFDVIGLSFPGVPGFAHFGHNADVAWCITHAMCDDTDVFVEAPADVVERATESISVRGADPVEIATGHSPRGPYVLGDLDGDGKVLCTNWTGLFDDTTFECLRPMLSSGDCDELEEAVRQWVIPANNLLTADRAGNISFKIRGRIIERPAANRWTPVPGDDAHAWDGLAEVPHDDLQHWRNPGRGFLVTANNRVSDDGPYISLDFAGPSRHSRIVQLLTGIESATAADMTTIHGDVQSLAAPPICEIIAGLEPATELGRAARDLVAGWDHQVTADSAAAVVYGSFRQAWAGEVEDRIGIRSAAFGEPGWPRGLDASRMNFDAGTILLLRGGWRLLPGLDDESTLASVLADLLDQVAATLAAERGDDPSAWRWDHQHLMFSPHPLALGVAEAADLHPPVIGVAGDGETVRAGGIAPMLGLQCYLSSCARYVFDVADWDNSGWVVPHGVSGVRGSGHDLDQRAVWASCEVLPMAYSPAAVAEVATSTQTLAV